MNRKYGLAAKVKGRKRGTKFEWFGSEFARNVAAKSAVDAGYKVRKLTRKVSTGKVL